MKARRVWAVARKEFLHVLRDPRSLGMAIAIPMLMLVLFGFALTVDVDRVPTVVWDQCGSPSSREFVARFDGSPYFSVIGSAEDYGAIQSALDRREAMIALVIPPDFSEKIQRGQTTTVQAIADASDSNTATIALGYAEAIARIYGAETAVRRLQRQGMPPIRPALDVRQRVWFNEDRESRNYIIPGLIAVIMMVIAAMLTSLTVAREWERGTMEQLISTPVKGPELIVGKLAPYFVLGAVDVTLAVLMGEFVFRVPLRGSAALVFATGAVFLAGALSMGMLISIVARNQLLASQMAMTTTFLPAFLLSGFMIPIANMPPPIQVVTYIVPARYFVSILHAIYLKGVGLEIIAGEAILLALFCAVTVAAANLKFRKRLA